MKKELEALEKLQAVELTIANLQRRIADIPLRLQQLERDQEQSSNGLRAAEARLTESEKERRRLEGEVADLRAKISKYQDQSLQVKTNVEYQAILKEIATTKYQIDTVETHILERLLEADTLKAKVKEERESSARLQTEIQAERARVEAERVALDRELAAGREERETQARELTAEVLRLYQRIRDARDGMALAVAVGELCSGCKMRIRPQHLTDLKLGAELVQCEHCQRILLWKEPPPTPTPADAAS
jgi:predicted  nucleic acid-binding Zn-ribbon protein